MSELELACQCNAFATEKMKWWQKKKIYADHKSTKHTKTKVNWNFVWSERRRPRMLDQFPLDTTISNDLVRGAIVEEKNVTQNSA